VAILDRGRSGASNQLEGDLRRLPPKVLDKKNLSFSARAQAVDEPITNRPRTVGNPNR